MTAQAAPANDTVPNRFWTDTLEAADPEVFGAVRGELARQQDRIELIASENIASRAVLEAAGTVFTNKYAEGYPGKRYYGGCEYADVVETLAIERAKAADSGSLTSAQRTPGLRLTAIEIPIPLPHSATPNSAVPSATTAARS